MVNIEMALIVAFGVLNALLIVAFGSWTMKTIIRGLAELDMRISEAITSLVNDAIENLTPDLEPVNPIVSIFADHLRNQMNPTIVAKDITRDDSGKFQSDNV